MTSRYCTVDIGNSSVGVGCWSDGELQVERFQEARLAAARVGSQGEPVAIISVAPERLSALLSELRVHRKEPVQVLTRAPESLGAQELLSSAGADRIAVVLAARPGPAIVIDAGTAVTVEVIEASGRYLGGFIGAGPSSAARGLTGAAALLPRAAGTRTRIEPGTSTSAALSAGLWGMAVGGVDRLVDAALARLPPEPAPRLVCTGGWGAAWAADSRHHDVIADAELVHRGIARWAGWPLDR